MGLLARKSFTGWAPDSDQINASPTALLRMDNLVLDELGAVSLRKGSSKINGSAFADTDVHSLFTVNLSGTRYRMAGATNKVYANGTALSPTMAGSDDVAFGSHLGQIFFARSTSKHKYDGTTVRPWGVSMTGIQPTISTGTAVSGGGFILTGNSTESPAVVYTEDDGTGATFADGFDATANGAIVLHPKVSNFRGILTKTFAAPTDYSSFSDNDYFSLYFYVTDPAQIFSLGVSVDVNDGTSLIDAYITSWFNNSDPELGAITTDFPIAGWNRLSIRRGDMFRLGSTAGKDWSTVKAIRLTVVANTSGASATVRFDAVGLATGSTGTGTIAARWKYIYVFNSGTYFGKSAPSSASSDSNFSPLGVTVTVPADASRESQVNEIWVYREDDNLGGFYRVARKTGVTGTAAVDIADVLSDEDALIVNLPLEDDNTVPPNSIIDIAGPYFDRIFALTASFLYPSRRLNPDSFSAAQVIRVAGADETALWVQKTAYGLLIGTTKDIYRLDGTGAELPDGTVEFTLAPLNIDNPPISIGTVAQEGNLLTYLAADGWRAIEGAGSRLIVGDTSLLYKGYTRQGVSPVNLTTGRVRATIVAGQLVSITPEGASTTSSPTIYRFQFLQQRWYRFTYGSQTWRAVFREPDGTLIASDSSGFVWILDSGTQDAGSNIALVMWTKVDDDGLPFNRKDPWDIRVRADTGGGNASVAVHLDNSGSAATTVTVTQSGAGVTIGSLNSIATFRQVQLRITGSLSTFLWLDFGISYRERTILQTFVEMKPELPSPSRRRFGGLKVIADTLSGDATITPVLDGSDQATFTMNTGNPLAKTFTFAAAIGRDLWAKISKATGFELYSVEPLILEELPTKQKGRIAPTDAGYPYRKWFGGIEIRLCTLGAAVTVTPIVNGVSQSTFSITTGADESTEVTHLFPNPIIGRDIALSFSGDVEIYSWKPQVLMQIPYMTQGETPPNNGGYPGKKTMSGFQMRICTLAVQRVVTAKIDGSDYESFNVNTDCNNPLEVTLAFAVPAQGVELSLHIDGVNELYNWSPLVTANRPLGIKSWDSGPLDLGMDEMVWPREVWMKVEAGADLTVTPYFDGTAYATVTATIPAADFGLTTKVRIPLPRGYKGKIPRFDIRSSASFFPYWIEFKVRHTTDAKEKEPIRVAAKVGGEVVG